jgi:hypothetical protein
LDKSPEQIDDNTEHQENMETTVFEDEHVDDGGKVSAAILLIPLLLSVYLFLGFTNVDVKHTHSKKVKLADEEMYEEEGAPKVNFSALLAPEEFSKGLRDTVYTDLDIWLEMRIDEQQLYVHHRDGRIIKYPVSSGNPHASKSVESRPGLFAIFFKTEVHLSSQFNNARMNYFMPYNMGIGFHGLPGTGYYGHLGVRPSSHGCIRMRNEDVRVLFGQCPIGTLVLSHRGKSARIVAFAPKDFKNDVQYTKDDYLNMLAYNMGAIMEGKYFERPPKKFILDGTVIPKSGINVITTDNIPDKQVLPFAVYRIKVLHKLKFSHPRLLLIFRQIRKWLKNMYIILLVYYRIFRQIGNKIPVL